MFASITTVGFGDIIPYTNLGRLVTMLACITGNFIVQSITVVLMKYL